LEFFTRPDAKSHRYSPTAGSKTELSRTFSKEEVKMAKKHMKKCSSSLDINEMQIKTTLRFHHTPVRITTIKNTTKVGLGSHDPRGSLQGESKYRRYRNR
jgi:hypothetical protein